MSAPQWCPECDYQLRTGPDGALRCVNYECVHGVVPVGELLSSSEPACPTCEGDGTALRPFDGNCPAAWAHIFLRPRVALNGDEAFQRWIAEASDAMPDFLDADAIARAIRSAFFAGRESGGAK